MKYPTKTQDGIIICNKTCKQPVQLSNKQRRTNMLSRYYCDIHDETHRFTCISCADDRRAQRMMRIFVLSHGYVAVLSHDEDIKYWGGNVLNLAYDSRTDCNTVVNRMRENNPQNLVVFSGGLNEYKATVQP